MNPLMLDTNICSYIIRERPLAVAVRLESVGEAMISCITDYELVRGALNQPRLFERVEQFLRRVAVLAWDQAAARHAAQIWADLTVRGQRIGDNDILIAGHALAAGCTLVTNNTREFARVAGLQIEDWS